jgi:hypothetical protein
MQSGSKQKEERLPSEVTVHPDGQMVEVDSIGVSHFYLPPSRCKTCVD